MSRVGLNPITIPEGVQYKFEDQVFSVNSQKGNLSLRLAIGFTISEENSVLTIIRPNDEKVAAIFLATIPLFPTPDVINLPRFLKQLL